MKRINPIKTLCYITFKMSKLWAPTTLINLFLENYMKKYIIFVCGIWKNSKYFSLVGYDLSEQEER